MSGTYEIIETLPHPNPRKAARRVSFNGHPGEYCEVDLDGPFPDDLVLDEATDEQKVAAVLQLVADQNSSK